ncbi:MAG: histidinol dehydrogenase [Saprospiraceae bacterium]|nr:histidinol dehydrogenase [Saprospiraceae bacterium]
MIINRFPDFNPNAPLLERPENLQSYNLSLAKTMLDEVRSGGDAAVRRFAGRFDGPLADVPLEVSAAEITAAIAKLPHELKTAIRQAYDNIRKFHLSQRESVTVVETMPGVSCWRRSTPIDKVGLYVPGGSAPLFSTALMLGVPAQIAGCEEVIMCSPEQGDLLPHPAVLYAASLCGITRIFRIGGVQAIGAMAYGTESVPKVWKIFGPGNKWVTAAKQLVSIDGVAIDMVAGPSEVAVIADASANPAVVAADLLSQAEHGSDSQVLLLCTEENLLQAILSELDRQLAVLPRREMASAALQKSNAILVNTTTEAMAWANAYAPEHLIIQTADAAQLALQVRNAGSVFLGHLTPESAGDYASGTNHTLPTGGYARSGAGVSLDSFVKKITFQEITPEGLENLAQTVTTMARAEELEAHARAIEVRSSEFGVRRAESVGAPLAGARDAAGALDAPGEPNSAAHDALIEGLIRENIRSLKPYSSARDEFKTAGKDNTELLANVNPADEMAPLQTKGHPQGAPLQTPDFGQILGLAGITTPNSELQTPNLIFLDANENSLAHPWNRYPDARQREMKQAVGKLKGVAPNQIFLGNGSDEAIDLLMRAFVEPGKDNIILMPPTYGMYAVQAGIHGASVRKAPLRAEFSPDMGALRQETDENSKLLFVCSPNNPSGNRIPDPFIEDVLEFFPGLVVVDEAYIDFSDKPSWLTRLNQHPRLVVLQTFSKAWGLAGLRLGMAFAHPKVIEVLDKIKYPYNLSSANIGLLYEALGKQDVVEEQVKTLIAERRRLETELPRLSVVEKVFPSDANFLLVRVKDAAKIYQYLIEKGIVVRRRDGELHCEHCLRFTVGTPEENERLLAALHDV